METSRLYDEEVAYEYDMGMCFLVQKQPVFWVKDDDPH